MIKVGATAAGGLVRGAFRWGIHAAVVAVGVLPRLCVNLAVWQGGNNSVVECDLAKVEVAGSNPVSRSNL